MEINSLYYNRALSINMVGGAYAYAIIPRGCLPLILCVWKALVKQYVQFYILWLVSLALFLFAP